MYNNETNTITNNYFKLIGVIPLNDLYVYFYRQLLIDNIEYNILNDIFRWHNIHEMFCQILPSIVEYIIIEKNTLEDDYYIQLIETMFDFGFKDPYKVTHGMLNIIVLLINSYSNIKITEMYKDINISCYLKEEEQYFPHLYIQEMRNSVRNSFRH